MKRRALLAHLQQNGYLPVGGSTPPQSIAFLPTLPISGIGYRFLAFFHLVRVDPFPRRADVAP
jgi:hypothetical protein